MNITRTIAALTASAALAAGAGVVAQADVASAAPVSTTAVAAKPLRYRTCIAGWMLSTPNVTCAFALDTAETLRANQRATQVNVYSKATRKRHVVRCVRWTNRTGAFAQCTTGTGWMLIRFP